MAGMGDHAKPAQRKNHLWILAVIATAAAIPVGAGWVGLGNIAGFPVIFGQSTGWTLVVSLEAYGGYAVYIWLGAAPGERSRQFAQRSAIGVLALSLIGQASYHLMLARHAMRLPALVVVFAACLPVVVLSLAAILMHLCHADERVAEEAESRKAETERQAAIERAEADERTVLRTELEAMREAIGAAETARSDAEQRAAEAVAETEKLTRRLAANSGPKGSRNAGARKGPNSGRTAPATAVPKDVDARAEALRILTENPDISGRELGELCGRGERWGQMRKQELAGHVTGGEAPAGLAQRAQLAPCVPVPHYVPHGGAELPLRYQAALTPSAIAPAARECEAKTRDTEGIWHPAKTYQAFCSPCTDRITACAAELPPLYGYLYHGGAPARTGRPVRIPPGPRILVSPVTDALLRTAAAQTGGWAARTRSVPGLSLSRSPHPHGSPERLRDDCRVLALHPGPLLALAEGPTVRAYPWPLTGEEETRLADCEIVRMGGDWVHVIEMLAGPVAGAEILELHYRARKLTGQAPAPPDLLDGIPCRSCEAMSSLEVIPAPPPDPEKPPPAFAGAAGRVPRRDTPRGV